MNKPGRPYAYPTFTTKADLVKAARELNELMGLKPPINVYAGKEQLMTAIAHAAKEITEDDEFNDKTTEVLKALETHKLTETMFPFSTLFKKVTPIKEELNTVQIDLLFMIKELGQVIRLLGILKTEKHEDEELKFLYLKSATEHARAAVTKILMSGQFSQKEQLIIRAFALDTEDMKENT
jgi:hypothetical protein